jgi:WD40 repeat protein/serine/threonine protein kinase
VTVRCLDDNTITLLVDGALSEDQRAHADAHIDICGRCRDLVVGVVKEDAQTQKLVGESEGPATTRRDIRRRAPDVAAPPDSAGPDPHTWKKDDLIEHYRILRHLGRGGVGMVYVARDTRLGRRVALKTLRSVTLSAETTEGFMREARITAKLNHPNIVTIYEVAQHRGVPFLALEYVHGRSLYERLKDQRWPSVHESVRIGLAVAEALVHAHHHGVLHRDLKPGNVVIDQEGRVRVVDFGLAVVIDDRPSEEEGEPRSVRNDGEVEGTPLYMAPEQWCGEPSSAATDVWALGVMLYLLIARRHPFNAATLADVFMAVSTEEPASWGDAVDTVVELEELVRRCLSKSASERPSAAEVLDTLRSILSAPRHAEISQDSPYRGLLAFRERDAGLFFGREEEITSFAERLRVHPILPVVGPSGAGKSSFIEAGVIPRLREQRPWVVVRMRPRSDPFSALAAALSRADSWASSPSGSELGKESSGSASRRELAKRLHEAPGELSVELLAMARRHGADVLLFVDQLEEAFSLVPDRAELEHFIQAVCSAADDELDPVRVVLTLRDDFVVRLAELQEGRHMLGHLTVLHAPSEAALAEMLRGPARVVGYQFDDPELVGEMIASLKGERACLPLLEFAAQELWERRDKKERLLLRSAYEELGGVAGALVRHADGVVDGLSQAELATARQLLLRLVTPDRTRRVVRASEALQGLGERGALVLERFTRARLVSVTRSKGQSEEDALVELVHGSLIHSYKTLSRWIDESHEELVFVEEIAEAAELWERRGRPPEALWTGDQLGDATRRLARATTEISETVQRFIGAAEQRRRRRLRRLRLAIAAVVGTLSVIAATAIYVAIYVDQQRSRAELFSAQSLLEGARGAYAQGSNLEARAKLRMALEIDDSVGARALWWQLQRDPLVWRQSIGAPVFGVDISPSGKLLACASQNRAVYLVDSQTRATTLLRGHRDQVIGVAFSPDGELLASSALDRTVRLWRVRTGKVERVLEGHESGVHGLAFSPDGKLVAAGGEDHSVRIWHVSSGKPAHLLRGHQGVVRGVAFSPDGRRLASGGGDQVVRLWNLNGREDEHEVLTGHDREVYSVAFSSDGKRLASASYDRTVRLWRLDTRATERVLHGHQASATGVRFSGDDRQVIAASTDGSIRFWDADGGKELRALREASVVWGVALSRDGHWMAATTNSHGLALWDVSLLVQVTEPRGHGEAVLAVDFSADGSWLASGGLDQTARIWSVERGTQERLIRLEAAISALAIHPRRNQLAHSGEGGTVRLSNLDGGGETKLLRGHTDQIYRLRFSADGRRLVSASFDGTARVWDVEGGETVAVMQAGSSHRLRGASLSADATQVVTAGDDGMLRVFDVASSTQVLELSGHEGRVYDASFSPDGAWIVSTGWDATVRLWNTTTGKGEVLGRHEGRGYGVAFHADGKRVATASADGTVRIWNIADKTQRVLRGHRNEVNDVKFSHDGKLLASASDDGTVRLWQLDPERPRWLGAGLMGTPPKLLTHAGWQSFDDGADEEAPSATADVTMQEKARRIAASRDGSGLCVYGHDETLSLYDTREGELVFARPVDELRELAATDDGCAVVAGGRAVLHTKSGAELALEATAPVTALSATGGHVLVASANGISEFDASGREVAHYAAAAGVSAMWLDSNRLLAGYRDGSIELVAKDGDTPLAIPFGHVPDSEVVRLLLGPQSTIIAGYANGTLGMWDTNDGSLLALTRIHGPVSHLVLEGQHLNAASELGQTMRWDLKSFHEDHCDALSGLWEKVPVVWENGRAHLQPPPSGHPCRR